MPRAAHIDIGSSSSIWHCLEHTCAQWPVAFTLALYMWETDPPRALACAHVWCLSPLSTTRSKVRQAQSTAQSISCATGPSRPHFRLRVRGGGRDQKEDSNHTAWRTGCLTGHSSTGYHSHLLGSAVSQIRALDTRPTGGAYH